MSVMKKTPDQIEEFLGGAARKDNALARALKMPPAPFTPKVTLKAKTKKKAGTKDGSK